MAEENPTAWAAFIGALASILVNFVWYFVSRRINIFREITLIKGELNDLVRHFKANVSIVEAIDLEQGIPSLLHIRKLAVYEDSIIFSKESYRLTNKKRLNHLYRLKTELRNINVEVDAIHQYVQDGAVDKKILQEFLDYMHAKFERQLSRVIMFKANGLTFTDPTIKKKKEVTIVYERTWAERA